MNDCTSPNHCDDPSGSAGRLRTALRSRATIKQATGLLMQREGLGAEDARTRLRQIASQQEVAVNLVAGRLLDDARPR